MIVRRTKDAAEGRLSLLVYSEVCCRSHSYFEDVAERSEQKLDKRTILFSRGLSAELGTELPSPGDPLTLGIDAGYVRGQHKQGQFGVSRQESLGDSSREVLCPSSSPTHVHVSFIPHIC
jgi:hypothetical protein